MTFCLHALVTQSLWKNIMLLVHNGNYSCSQPCVQATLQFLIICDVVYKDSRVTLHVTLLCHTCANWQCSFSFSEHCSTKQFLIISHLTCVLHLSAIPRTCIHTWDATWIHLYSHVHAKTKGKLWRATFTYSLLHALVVQSWSVTQPFSYPPNWNLSCK